MRFGIPRSVSPSPERAPRKRRSKRSPPKPTNRFGLANDDASSSSSAGSSSDESEDSFCYASESEIPLSKRPPQKTSRLTRSIEEAVASIKLTTNYDDPYEDWERNTRQEALQIAQRVHTEKMLLLESAQSEIHKREDQRLAMAHAEQLRKIQERLDAFQQMQNKAEAELQRRLAERQKLLFEGIDRVIELETKKARLKLEAEQKAREEQERKKKEEEDKRKAEEDKRKAAEEKVRKEQEEKTKKEQEAKQEQDKLEQLAREQAELQQREAKENIAARAAIGLTTPQEDWKSARDHLQALKSASVRPVKADKQMKAAWGDVRRKITPKIGQLTDSAREIDRISTEIYNLIHPTSSSGQVYGACLSSLAKAIILQAETEVTAEKRSAGPLSQVAMHMLGALDGFGQVFWAKLVQRVGGWAVPTVPTGKWTSQEDQMKAHGIRKEEGGWETTAARIPRVAGIMRVYFGILHQSSTSKKKLEHQAFQAPRLWVWLARLMRNQTFWGDPMTAELLYVALDEMGMTAKRIWGKQFVKMVEMIYEGTKRGYEPNKFIGGDTSEGKAARVRLQTIIEEIMSKS